MTVQNDAFGNPITIGHLYAYSTGNSGITRVVLGAVERVSAKKVTLRVNMELTYVYGWLSSSDDPHASNGSVRSVYGCILFPYVEQSVAATPQPPRKSNNEILEA